MIKDDRLDDVNRYGFAWGPMNVVRLATFAKGRRVLRISTPSQDVEVYASATGRSLRVFKDGRELK